MSRKGRFDHILLETTGLADPGPIAAMFWQNEEFALGLGKDIYLDGVICVVDAVFGEKQIQEDTESDGIKHSLRQVAAADVLLLNKADLTSEADLVKTESILRRLNPSIPIYRTVRTQIDLSKVMGIGAYSEGSPVFLQDGSREICCDEHENCSNHKHSHEGHLSLEGKHAGISSIIANLPGPLNETQIIALDEWIRSVLWENSIPRDRYYSNTLDGVTSDVQRLSIHRNAGEEGASSPESGVEILRCKGIWWNERGEAFMLQGVRSLYEVSKLPNPTLDMYGPPIGKLVFIGKGLDEMVEGSLRRLVTDPTP
ncbi:CobW/HypB/UreG, nucleotide-binding domain-containing protein [Gautieria morchelliformis]|nr:CobW/HypB/UreG, nucleotide-binding domain-containing protein [Gautieria morchelliformis]